MWFDDDVDEGPLTQAEENDPRHALLKRWFGDDIVRRLHDELPYAWKHLNARQEPPFRWLERPAGLNRAVARWLVGDHIVEMRGVAGLRALVGQAVTSPDDPARLVRRAVQCADLDLVEHRAQLTALRPQDMTSPLPFVDRFEPPHFEGHVYVFFCIAHEEKESKESNRAEVLRVGVDVDSWSVSAEAMRPTVWHPRPVERVIIGRALVGEGGEVVTAAAPSPSSSSSERARKFRADALSEHASVASFARLTLELLALGAPLSLIARTHEAARDEIRHTRQFLALATRIDDVVVDLGAVPALPPRPGDKRALAQRTFDEAVVPERAAVELLRADAAGAEDAEERAILLAQADDEERHVALARDILRWSRT